jgi:hypothetical protein
LTDALRKRPRDELLLYALGTVYERKGEVQKSLESMTRGEADIAISTAKKFPRSISKFRQDAMSMATADVDVAASCFYRLQRGGKVIEGPSARLAEIIASAWGNMKFGARVVSEDDKFITAQGVAHDLEKNVYTSIEVRRRITDKNGQRYNDDMIVVTGNAASSIALRNAIFKTIPFTYAKTVYEQAKRTAIGDAKTIGMRRTGMIEAFAKIGVTQEMLLNFVGCPSMEDVGLREIEQLIGTFSAIKEGDTTIDEQFPEASISPEQAEQIKKIRKLRAALNKSLITVESLEQHADVKAAFETANGATIWAEKTHVRDNETFGDLLSQKEAGIRSNMVTIITRIKNAEGVPAFERATDDFMKHPQLDTQENHDLIAEVGRALGIEQYAK